jgi:hypothetical protein
MADQQNATELLKTLLFSGDFKKDGSPSEGTLLAVDFVREIKSRKGTYTWNDQRTMEHVKGSLRGKAAQWFNKTMPRLMSATEYTAFSSNFTADFLPKFKEMFLIKDTEALVDWRDISRQRANEPVDSYTTRIFTELDNLAEFVAEDAILDYTPIPLEAAGVAIIENLTDAQQLALRPFLVTKEQADLRKCTKVTVNKMCQAIARRLIVAGVRSEELRSLAFEYHSAKKNTLDFVTTVHLAADRIASKSEPGSGTATSTTNQGKQGAFGNNANGNKYQKKNKNKNNASAVEEESSKPEEVEAATGTRPKQPPASRGQQGQARQPPKCTYCGRLFHTERNCYTRQNHEEAAKKSRPARPANAEETDTEAAASSVSQAGNCFAGW